MQPSLKNAVFYAVVSAVSFILASDYGPRLPTWGRLVLVALGIITGAAALADGINWLTFTLTHRVAEYRKTQAINPLSEMLAMMPRLTPQAQTELALHFHLLGVDYRALIGEPEPAFLFTYQKENIPFEFISDFFALSTDAHLPAVRQWGEGTHERKWATALTAYLVRYGYAQIGRGNQPAAWLPEYGNRSKKARAERAFGLVEVERVRP